MMRRTWKGLLDENGKGLTKNGGHGKDTVEEIGRPVGNDVHDPWTSAGQNGMMLQPLPSDGRSGISSFSRHFWASQ